MSSLFHLVAELSGQKNVITIPRIYIKLCSGDLVMASVLSQLVFWSSKGKRSDGFFWKTYEELANEICDSEITVEQIRYAVKKLKALLPDCLTVKVKRVNGIATNHYYFDQSKFLHRLMSLNHHPRTGNFPNAECENSHAEMGNLPIQPSGNFPDPLTDHNHNKTTDPIQSAHAEEQAVCSHRNSANLDYTQIATVYNQCVERENVIMNKVRTPHLLIDKRKKAIKKAAAFLRQEFENKNIVDVFEDYFTDFIQQAKKRPDQFYFGGGSRGWIANFDYLLREEVITKVMEDNV